MNARLMLAALDWNSRLHKPALDSDNKPIYDLASSKRRKQWVIKARYKNVSGQHIPMLISRVLEVQANNIVLPKMSVPKDLPRNIAATEKPAKEPMMEVYHSTRRFSQPS